ncbi:23038_t:CDS:2 [Gigaspora margarita]|uniref:23038_t:CDS:1 n=1 Tax=Gigaspora margarita TaxID=4874 RepID=A0ABN7V326_GIGMA|nr:23038_t:CDS:2 [Gigaspora margarita]
MTDTKKPQEQEVEKEMAVAKGLAVAEEMSEELKKSEDKENVEDKKIESIIEAGARTVALVDENVMMAMPELLETNPYTSEMTA